MYYIVNNLLLVYIAYLDFITVYLLLQLSPDFLYDQE